MTRYDDLMSQLTKMIDERTTPDPALNQPITGIPARQRRRQTLDPITTILVWLCVVLGVMTVVAQVWTWLG